MDFTIAKLTLYKNNIAIRKYNINKGLQIPIVIGKMGYGAVIELDSTYISRRHAQILLANDTFLTIQDLQSTNGTFLNNTLLPAQQTATLKNGDTLTFGTKTDYSLYIELLNTDQGDETIIKNRSDLALFDNNPNNNPTTQQTPVNDKHPHDLISLLSQKNEIVIGRSKDCDIVLPELVITRQHATITKTANNEYVIKDLDSKNGTFVNGKRIKEPTYITQNDTINIGAYQFKLLRPAQDIRNYNAIVAENLIKTVNDKQVILNDVSFKIPAQEFVAIMGPSGCGKSTLLKALNGDSPATSGRIFIHDIELYSNYDYLKRLIGYVPQDDIVHRELTVQKSLYYAAKLRLPPDVTEEDIQQKIDEVLHNLHIGDPEVRQRKVGDLSGGQRKRVSIAVELLTDPSILFLDEPTSPLDPETIEDFLTCLNDLAQKKGTTILMVTHKPDDLYYVNTVLFLSKGGLLAYYGNKQEYLPFFGAKNVIEVYAQNSTPEKGRYWSNKWKGMYPQSGTAPKANAPIERNDNDSAIKQLWWLTVRYFNIKTNDRTNTFILLAQAPIIACLVALIFGEVELSVLFLTTVSAIWFGVNNSAKEIIGELPIYKRERMFNLKIIPYMLSKILVLSFFSLLQTLIFVAILYIFVGNNNVSLQSYWLLAGIMFYIAFSATLQGLTVSTFVNNTEKVMSIVPIVLIPQIMLAGVMAPIKEKTVVEFVSYGMLSRWGTQSFAYAQDSIRSYMANPLCPNELTYQTVKAVEFLNLPNTLNLPEKLSSSLYALTVLNIIFLATIFWGLKKKDSV